MIQNVDWICLDCGMEGTAEACTADAWGAIRIAVQGHTKLSPSCPWEWARIFPKTKTMTDTPMKPSARIIADSISEQGRRLVTMEVVMHRFILAEMNTHRAFSRNSASSRAIPYDSVQNPTNSMRWKVMNNDAYPVHWGKEQKGMQSGEVLDSGTISLVKEHWDRMKRISIGCADELYKLKLHKSLINRLLEPFMWHTAIISATEWDNFFWQRCDPAAQPEMKAVADEMQRAYYTSKPRMLAHGEWHMPYIQSVDWNAVEALHPKESQLGHIQLLKMVSAARCARVSYLTHDGIRSIEKDIELYNRLAESGHWSPFEHVATPMYVTRRNDITGNFVGWKQFRKEFRNENRTGFVPNLPDLIHLRDGQNA
jgi:thymidylate synthase ThyX